MAEIKMTKYLNLLVFGFSAFILFAERAQSTPAEREALLGRLSKGELALTPTFSSCSVSFCTEKNDNMKLEFRAKGSVSWNQALTPYYYPETGEYRGSIVHLDENTVYEVRFVENGKVKKQGEFRTWRSDVPIARTVWIEPSRVKFPVVVSDRGKPDGWVRYMVRGGKLVNTDPVHTFLVTNAAYVVFDDMDIHGGEAGDVFHMRDSVGIRIRNLNIHDWGEARQPDFSEAKKGRCIPVKHKWNTGWSQPAIRIGEGMKETVVERCWVHDPKECGNSWYYSHPYGPTAINMQYPDGSTVLRWNDFIGSDDKRWNDAVASIGNFTENGGFNRDADIFGNYMCFAADDSIEIDGGQRNVRVYGNRFDMSFTGLSVQGNVISPSYVWSNIIGGSREEFGLQGATLKTAGVKKNNPSDCVSWIFNNTFWGEGDGFCCRPGFTAYLYNNLFLGKQMLKTSMKDNPQDGIAQTVFRANTVSEKKIDVSGIDIGDSATSGEEIPNFASKGVVRGAVQNGQTQSMWPIRPLPFVLDRFTVDAGRSRAPVTVRAKWIGPGENKPIPFVIAKNDAFDWFAVEPARGVIAPGKDFEFEVTFTGKKPDRRFWNGVFLVRTDEGLSRPCLVRAETSYVPPERPIIPEGSFASFADESSFTPDADGWISATFDIPKKSRYWFFVRGTGNYSAHIVSKRPKIQVSVDGAKPQISQQQADKYPTWTMLAPDRRFGLMIREYILTPGRHNIRIRVMPGSKFKIDGLAVSDNPKAFERR